MTFFTAPTRLVLYSYLNPDECARRIATGVDPERLTIFSLSGYRGSKPFLGRVESRQFRLMQRTYGRNILPPVLSGQFLPRGRGTQVNGLFDIELTSKIFICFILAICLLIMLTVIIYLFPHPSSYQWIAAVGVCAYLILAFVIPRIVRGLGLDQERDIRDFLCTTLEAGDDASAFKFERK